MQLSVQQISYIYETFRNNACEDQPPQLLLCSSVKTMRSLLMVWCLFCRLVTSAFENLRANSQCQWCRTNNTIFARIDLKDDVDFALNIMAACQRVEECFVFALNVKHLTRRILTVISVESHTVISSTQAMAETVRESSYNTMP